MEEHQNEALIQRVPSQETVAGRGGNSNGKALKVTGLTVLACLLLAGQALTAYLVYGQKEHLSALTTGQEKLKTELTKKMSASAPPKAMHLPMNSMPLLTNFPDESSDRPSRKKSSVPLVKLQPVYTNQREGSGQMDASRMGRKSMQLPMQSLPLMMEDEIKSIPESEVEVESKCQLESQREVRPGFFKPECDEQGNYKPMQCWHSTGYCWCVEKDGTEIPNTRIRGRPDCS